MPSSSQCYQTWDALNSAIKKSSSQGTTFRLCPDTTFNVEGKKPIAIKQSDTVIACQNCVVEGGQAGHFVLEQLSTTNVLFRGITFQNATEGVAVSFAR